MSPRGAQWAAAFEQRGFIGPAVWKEGRYSELVKDDAGWIRLLKVGSQRKKR